MKLAEESEELRGNFAALLCVKVKVFTSAHQQQQLQPGRLQYFTVAPSFRILLLFYAVTAVVAVITVVFIITVVRYLQLRFSKAGYSYNMTLCCEQWRLLGIAYKIKLSQFFSN